MRCFNCGKELAEGFDRCPHCGASTSYSDIDSIKEATTLNTQGNMLASQGKQREAIEAYRAALERFPDYAVCHYNLGLSYHAVKDYREAIESFSRAIDLKSDFAAAYTGRGDALLGLNRPDEAIADYTKAIELYPDYAVAYFKRGEVYSDTEQLEESLSDFRSYLTYKPHDVRAKRRLKQLRELSGAWSPDDD